MKPSDIDLTTHFPPLIATLDKTEYEVAAAIIIRACVVHGDRWQPVSYKMIRDVLVQDMENRVEPILSISTNPFALPDFVGLKTKWATSTEEPKGTMTMSLTEQAIRRIGEKHGPPHLRVSGH